MPTKPSSRGWRICCRCLRGMRTCVLLLTFVVLAATVYLNEVGVPAMLKGPLIKQLHERGVDLQFSRLRLRWYRGLVAEDVHFGTAHRDVSAPEISIQTVEVKLNHAALAKFHLQVDSLVLNNGRLNWLVSEPDQPQQQLTAENIQTQLRLLPNDQWELDHFSAEFAGTQLRFSGSLTNASSLRDWKIFHTTHGPQPEATRQRLRELVTIIERIKFAAPPELAVNFHGDARDARSFNGFLTLNAPGATTPWGTLTNGVLTTRLTAATATNREPQTEFKLRADEAVTRWGSTSNFQMHLFAITDESLTNRVRARLELLADRFATEWIEATNAQFSAEWTHAFTNPIPLGAKIGLSLADAHARWGNAAKLQFDAQLSAPATNVFPQIDSSGDWWTNPIPLIGTAKLHAINASIRQGNAAEIDVDARINAPETNWTSHANRQWAWWAYLEPYLLDWNCRVKELRAQEFELKEMVWGGLWRAPMLTITNLGAEMYGGRLDVQAALDVATRVMSFHAISDFDVQKSTPFLTAGGRRWFAEQQFSWKLPPLAHAAGGLTLPAWTNAHPDWRHEVLPAFWLQGDFKVGTASFRQVAVTSAQSHVSYTNMTWRLPDLSAIRPEGKIDLALESDDQTKDYYVRVHSLIDVDALRPVLDPKSQRGLDAFTFTQPPRIDGELWGRWHDTSRLLATAKVALTNFTFRGQSATHFHAALQYTNGFLQLTDGRIERGHEYGTASWMGVNFAAHEIYLTNGFSTLEPTAVVNAIGPKVAKTIEPYHFVQPPTVHVNGVIPLQGDVPADLHFKVDGGPFQWMKFNIQHISGGVDWVDQHLNLTQMQAAFYNGSLTGSAMFDFDPDDGASFSFDTIVTDADLRMLMADLVAPTNRLEGRLSGHLNITHADTQDWESWFGRGQVDLRDGLIWEIPVFGIFSQVLNGIYPGLGESRANRGSAAFIITNSVIRTDSLEIRSPALRMQYRGTVGFDGRVDAIVEARVLRDFWLVGPLLSTVLSPLTKLFEYKVTGTLAHPKSEPRIINFLFRSPKPAPPINPPPSTGPPPVLPPAKGP